ncbi:MAG: hypothetical protein ABIV51_07265 [Saprospiraceae bacterium]
MKLIIASIMLLTLGYTSCNKKGTDTGTAKVETPQYTSPPSEFDAKYVETQLKPIFDRYNVAKTEDEKKAIKMEVGTKVNQLGALYPGHGDQIFEVWSKLLNGLGSGSKVDSTLAPPGSGKKMLKPKQ